MQGTALFGNLTPENLARNDARKAFASFCSRLDTFESQAYLLDIITLHDRWCYLASVTVFQSLSLS